MFLEIDTIPFCCGVAVLGEFGEDYWDDDKSYTIADKVTLIRDTLHDERRPVIATINEDQREDWGNALSRAGFKVVDSFTNPNSLNKVFIYYKKRPVARKKPAKKRKS